MANDHHHRATLKQSNKSFKSKHASKGSLKTAAKGKMAPPAPDGKSHKSATSASSKKARLNANAQKRETKRKAVAEDVRFFSTVSGGAGAPRIVSVVPLLPSLSPQRFLRDLLPTFGLPDSELDDIHSSLEERGTYLIRAPRFKTSLQVNLLPSLDVWSTLDAALVSDYVVLLSSSVDEVQLEGEAVLRCLQGQAGGVEVLSSVQAPQDQPITTSNRSLVHKSLLSFTRYFFPSVVKMYSSDTPNESALLARALCEGTPVGSKRDDSRAYLVAEGSGGTKWISSGTSEEGEERGRLEVTGTIRGGCLSADRLIHIPGRGDFQVEAIMPAGPSSLTRVGRPHQQSNMTLDENSLPLSTPSAVADDLVATNIPDTSMNEQTWPTEDEMGASANGTGGLHGERRTKRVPKGTSAYQAAWIFDDEDDDGDDGEDDDGEGTMDKGDGDDDQQDVPFDCDGDEETEEIELDSRRSEIHRDLDPEQEEAEYTEYLRTREKAQQEDLHFPDEIDTPRHIPARTRFQRYRGLQSFRTSPWDPYENLPMDYGKIFQFESFGATSRRIEREGRDNGIRPGTRVTLVIKGVPRSGVGDRPRGAPFIVHGLLQHEHKQSVLHFAVQRNTEYTEPVKAKEPLVLCVGPRRYTIRPLYSQHIRGGGKGVNNVHKTEKFLRPGAATVATTFGPVVFGKAPCLLIKDEGAGRVPSLVAMGSSLPPDPTRIIAKRLILTGHPFKIHKRTATIRYMFFERDDVEYFQPIELHTKYGRVGHITEPLGTHGYFKAHFDGPIGAMDTICMSLYKRQFPKWAEDHRPGEKMDIERVEEGDGEMEVEQ